MSSSAGLDPRQKEQLTGDEDLCQNDLEPTMEADQNDINEHSSLPEDLLNPAGKISQLRISKVKSTLGVSSTIGLKDQHVS